MIAFGVCVGNEETYRRYAMPTISSLAEHDSILLSSRNNSSISEAYNEMLEYLRCNDALEALILLHEDVELSDPKLLDKVREALQDESVGLLGVIGAKGVTSLRWWEATGMGSCHETRGFIDYGGGTHAVDAIDGLIMALSPWAVRHVAFDASNFRGFHGYDVDYSFSIREAGRRVIVTDIDLFHHTKGGYGDSLQFQQNDAAFQEKWMRQSPVKLYERDDEHDHRRPSTGLISTPQDKAPVRIDLGGGKIPRSGWVNLDPVHGSGEWRRAAQQVPWPAESNSISEIYSSHMMEHIPAGMERITVMNEAWRTLIPGGPFEIRVPLFPRWEAIADPTHVSFWVPQSFLYFTGQIAADADYGIKLWELENVIVHDGWELRAILRKPRP